MQFSTLVDPVEFVCVPLGQGKHVDEFVACVALEYVSSGHGVGSVEPNGQKFPFGHGVGDAASAGQKFPTPHAIAGDEALGQYVPGRQVYEKFQMRSAS